MSMTGYGSHRARTKDIEVEVSIRSVNGRYLDGRFHLPKEYFSVEGELRKQLAKKVLRGSVDVFVHRRPGPSLTQKKLSVQSKYLKQWQSVLSAIAKQTKQELKLSVMDLARLEDVVKIDAQEVALAKEEALLKNAFHSALDQLQKTRSQEGLQLKRELSKLIHKLADLVEEISANSKVVEVQQKERFHEKWIVLKKEFSIDPQRMAQELLFYIDKSDIAEELTRLRTHIAQFEKLLSAAVVEGKKLDFYTQELLREVNTIGSKSGNSTITTLVIDAKSCIEKIREQVQNIE